MVITSSQSDLQGEGRGLEIDFSHSANDLINRAYLMKHQEKLWTPVHIGTSRMVNTWWEDDVLGLHREGTWKLCIQNALRPHLCVSFIVKL